MIAARIPGLTERSEFREHAQKSVSCAETLSHHVENLQQSSETLQKALSSITTRFENLKKSNFEAVMIHQHLQEVRDKLSSKADKIDICQIYDVMAKREEFQTVSQDSSGLKK